MSRAQPPPLPRRRPSGRGKTPSIGLGIRLYQAVCFFALAVIFLIELQRGIGLTSILVFLVGILAILSRLRMGPFLVLFVLTAAYGLRAVRAVMMARFEPYLPTEIEIHPVDLLLSLTMLIFFIAHYRLQALQLNVVPIDMRRILPHSRRKRPEQRSVRLVAAMEIIFLLLGAMCVTMLVAAIWRWTVQRGVWVGFNPRLGQLIWLIWILVFTAIVLRLLLRLTRRWQMKRDEAQLALQDVLWRQTRREQSRVHSWMAWAELRRGNRH